MIIAFGHRKRVGKDFAAAYLRQKYGAQRLAFADKLKEHCAELFQDVDRQTYIDYGNKVREIDPFAWIRVVSKQVMAGGDYCITDLRYPNEAAWVLSQGGFLVHVINPSVPDTNDIADCALEGWSHWDFTLVNDMGPGYLSGLEEVWGWCRKRTS